MIAIIDTAISTEDFDLIIYHHMFTTNGWWFTAFCINFMKPLHFKNYSFILQNQHGGQCIYYINYRRVPVDGKSSVCLICMKYRIIILSMIIISVGQILLLYNILQTHHARTRANVRARKHAAHTHTAAASAVQVSAINWRPPVMARSAGIHSP